MARTVTMMARVMTEFLRYLMGRPPNYWFLSYVRSTVTIQYKIIKQARIMFSLSFMLLELRETMFSRSIRLRGEGC